MIRASPLFLRRRGASPSSGGLRLRGCFSLGLGGRRRLLLLRRRILLLGGVFLGVSFFWFSLDFDFSPCSDFPASDLSPFLSFLCLRLFFDLFSPASSADSSVSLSASTNRVARATASLARFSTCNLCLLSRLFVRDVQVEGGVVDVAVVHALPDPEVLH